MRHKLLTVTLGVLAIGTLLGFQGQPPPAPCVGSDGGVFKCVPLPGPTDVTLS